MFSSIAMLTQQQMVELFQSFRRILRSIFIYEEGELNEESIYRNFLQVQMEIFFIITCSPNARSGSYSSGIIILITLYTILHPLHKNYYLNFSRVHA